MAWAAAHLPFALAGLAIVPLGLRREDGARTLGRKRNLFWTSDGAWCAYALRLQLHEKHSTRFNCRASRFQSRRKFAFNVPFYLLSPCLLFYAYYMVRGNVGDIGLSFRQRQGFRRSMEAATINPRDASAHYQLGLIYQHRHQFAEAISRFEKAVEIANDETDAHFQLGRIAREQGRLQDAINHFSVVLEQDDKHSQSEIWREIGATYLAASMFTEAKEALDKFIERRAYDPEGLYYYGNTLEQLGAAR